MKFLSSTVQKLSSEQTHRQTDGQTDRQTDRQMDRRTDRQTDTQTDRHTDRQTDSTEIITYPHTRMVINKLALTDYLPVRLYFAINSISSFDI